jgi:hypothetical protein
VATAEKQGLKGKALPPPDTNVGIGTGQKSLPFEAFNHLMIA